MANKKDTSKVISTKVTPLMFEKIKTFSENSELKTIYNFIQTLLFSFLRYADKETDVTYEMETMIKIYEDAFMLSSNSEGTNKRRKVNAKVTDAIYFEEGKGTNIKTAFYVSTNGNRKQVSYNVQQMVNLFLGNINPSLFAKLQTLKEILEFDNLIDVIDYIVDKYDVNKNSIAEDVKKIFSDNERIGFGNVSLEYENASVGNRHFSIDTARCNREENNNENVKTN